MPEEHGVFVSLSSKCFFLLGVSVAPVVNKPEQSSCRVPRLLASPLYPGQLHYPELGVPRSLRCCKGRVMALFQWHATSPESSVKLRTLREALIRL
jgi:hypothetical protein